jgi:hypothetical protein
MPEVLPDRQSTSDPTIDRLLSLLTEYTQKLETMYRGYIENAHFTSGPGRVVDFAASELLQFRIRQLLPAISELIRFASQYLEHADISGIPSLEFRLRLAELEGLYLAVRNRF